MSTAVPYILPVRPDVTDTWADITGSLLILVHQIADLGLALRTNDDAFTTPYDCYIFLSIRERIQVADIHFA